MLTGSLLLALVVARQDQGTRGPVGSKTTALTPRGWLGTRLAFVGRLPSAVF